MRAVKVTTVTTKMMMWLTLLTSVAIRAVKVSSLAAFSSRSCKRFHMGSMDNLVTPETSKLPSRDRCTLRGRVD